MSLPLKILIVEDCEADALLLVSHLRKAGYDPCFERVWSAEQVTESLSRGPWDLIVSDYSMPGFNGLAAMEMVKEDGTDAPFILVSGTVGEERAVSALKAGASDYILKDNLKRLVPAIERALAEAKERRDRKTTEEALRQSEARFSKVFQSSPVAMVLSTLAEGKIMEVNDAFLQAFGYVRDELTGRTSGEIGLWVVPEARARMQAEVREKGRVVNMEADFRKRSGEVGHSLASVELVEVGGVQCVLSLIHDITEKKRIEAQLLRNQRLENIGNLAAGIAHDLNNALSPILMSIELLRGNHPAKGDQAILSTLAASAQRAASMVQHVLTFSRGLSGEHTAVPTSRLLKDLSHVMRQTFPKNIRLEVNLPTNVWSIKGDATQVYQVLLNFTVNARDAMPEGGKLSLVATNVTIDEQFARMNADAHAGPHVCVLVKDTGTGIPPTVLARIFEPFFTTKPVGKGTGLGLSTARQIIQQHGGFMTIQTEVGWGTEFKVYFPALPSAAAAGAGSPEALPSGNGETILVVDDEASILDITTQTLRMSNYDVLTARDGAQAMAVFFQNRDKIKLVLTELTLPIMDGGALIRALQSVDARLQIIVSSSPIDDGRETDMTQYKVQFFLQKPYTAPQLLGAIHKSLQAPC